MGDRVQGVRTEQAALARALRTEGRTWPEVAAVFRDRYRVNARVALRLAHGLSQREVADRWNQRWANEPRSFKNISYWEQWPASTGHQPSLVALSRLAEIYQCGVADLLVDCGDHGHLDEMARPSPPSGSPAAWSITDVASGTSEYVSSENLETLELDDLSRTIMMWAERFNPLLDRRALLFKLSSALTVAAAAPAFDRILGGASTDRCVDAPHRDWLEGGSIVRARTVVDDCRRQGDVIGPQMALRSVLAERDFVRNLLHQRTSSSDRKEVMSLYAELTQLVGWFLFNLGDLRGARLYYDEARTTAHDAEDEELVTYVLCTMSHLETWQGRPRVGIDHAVAAQAWASRSGSRRACAYAGDVAARAYAADRQWDSCRRALEAERSALLAGTDSEDVANWWYFHDESFYWGTESECALAEGRGANALEASERSLSLIDASNVHNYAATLTLRGEALIQIGDPAEAARTLVDVARISIARHSQRIDSRVASLRRQLGPWDGTREVLMLDETLRVYRGSQPRERTKSS